MSTPQPTTPPSHILLSAVRTADRSPALDGMPAPHHRLTVTVFHLEWAGEDLDQVYRVAHHRHRVLDMGRALSTEVARIRREYVPAYHGLYAVPGRSAVQDWSLARLETPPARLVDHPAVSAWDHLLDLQRDHHLPYYGQDGVDLSAAMTSHHAGLPVLMAWTVDQSSMAGVDPRPEPGQVLGNGLLDPYAVEHG